jgi:hypothetical protein
MHATQEKYQHPVKNQPHWHSRAEFENEKNKAPTQFGLRPNNYGLSDHGCPFDLGGHRP